MAPQYASKLIYGNEVSDWQERLNTDRMRRERAERAKRIMREHGIPALLEANSANIRYLTGLKGFNYPMCRYTLFFADHDPVMYEHSGHFHQMPDQAPWITEWRPARAWLTAACGIEAAKDEAPAVRRRHPRRAQESRAPERENRLQRLRRYPPGRPSPTPASRTSWTSAW